MAVIKGTPGNDRLTGTPGDDVIEGGNGNDTLRGLGGDDVITGGNGNDRISGGTGDDTIDGGNGYDRIDAGAGDDTVDAGSGDDIVQGGQGNDTINAGQGQDRVDAGRGDDVVDGGDGDDSIRGGDGDDQLDGGTGQDSISGGDGDDVISGGDGDDTLFGNAGDDQISGGQGQDYLHGGIGDDTLDGGAGDDQLFGHEGNDILILGGGNDVADGSYGNDTFFVTPGDHQIIGGENPNGQDIDVLNMSGAGNYTIVYTGPESGIIEFRDANGNIFRRAQFKEIERIICFTPGTSIATMTGQRPVEDLRIGDRVFTRDNGAQEITWIGWRRITLGDGTLSQKLQPILIRKGALGSGLPDRDLLVSPNHRVLLLNKRAQLYFDETEVLVAAKHLVGMPGVEHWIASQVEYVHFMCERHEIVLSGGAWTETFQAAEQGLATLGDAQRQEIFNLFPELEKGKAAAFPSARRTLKRYEATLLSQ